MVTDKRTVVLADAGNSRFKWTRLRGGALSDVHSEEYGSQDRAHAVVAAWENSDVPRRIVVANVLGDDFARELTRATHARFRIEPEFVMPPRSGFGIHVAYANPEELGADRFAALVAARRNFPQHCLVVDCGTAVTIDALAADGQHLGGLILPGVALMRRSLIEHTARINVGFENNGDYYLFGRSTSQGVEGGTSRALVGAIDRIVRDMTSAIVERCGGSTVRYLITGGGAALVAPHLGADYHLEPWLVLQGLAVIAQAQVT